MADIIGYIGPNVSSGTYLWFPLSWAIADINNSIDTLAGNVAPGASWTQPTLTSGDLDGTLASGQISAFLWPYHIPGSDASCVPDIIGGALVGVFDGIYYVFYDPHALPPDPNPTGGFIDGYPVIGVACGTSADGTLQAFISSANTFTRWQFSAPNYTSSTDTVTVIAHHTGPDANVDSASPAGRFAPSVDYWGSGVAPLGGGWNVTSSPAPTTSDQMRIRIYERNFGGIFGAFDIQMPFQIPPPLLGDGSLMSAGANSIWDITIQGMVHTVSGVSNAAGEPVTITTADPHGFKVGEWIYTPGISGISSLVGAFPVIEVISTTQVALGAFVTYAFGASTFNIGVGPYQIVTGLQPEAPGFEVGESNLIVSCLNVPSAVGPTAINITAIVNTSGSVPVLITTDGPHGLTMQDRVLIAGIGGAKHVNGSWWVARIPMPNQLQISNAPLAFRFGNGATWSGGGTVSDITTPAGLFNITAIQNDTTDPIRITTSVPHHFLVGDVIGIAGAGGLSFLTNQWTCAEILSPTQFEIAAEDLSMLLGDGVAYTSGGTVTNGLFNAIIATDQFSGLNTPSSLYDDGQGTRVAVQGVFGFFPTHDRTLAHYSVALPVPMIGTQGDGDTTALKPLIMAPYVLARIAQNQESRIAGTFWDSYMQLQNAPYGTIETYQGVKFFAWAFQEGSFFNATLWIRAESI